MRLTLILFLLASFSNLGFSQEQKETNYIEPTPFFGDYDVLIGFERASPSFTADGKTMVYTRYTDWMLKMPFIAHLKNGMWESEPLEFVDYVYNLAISPDGRRIIYKKNFEENGEEISRVFVVDKRGGEWGTPKEVKTLYNMHAGYFSFTPDNVLYFFGRSPKVGSYYAYPHPDDIYTQPFWLSSDIAEGKPTSFDILMHPEKNKLIVTQDSFPEEMKDKVDGNGFYLFELIDYRWRRIKKLPLEYGWGANITPDGKFVYVRNSDIVYVNLKDLNINW